LIVSEWTPYWTNAGYLNVSVTWIQDCFQFIRHLMRVENFPCSVRSIAKTFHRAHIRHTYYDSQIRFRTGHTQRRGRLGSSLDSCSKAPGFDIGTPDGL